MNEYADIEGKEHIFDVSVGNVGYVLQNEHDEEKARLEFEEYVSISKTDTFSRAYNEQVTLWEDGEPIDEYTPPNWKE